MNYTEEIIRKNEEMYEVIKKDNLSNKVILHREIIEYEKPFKHSIVYQILNKNNVGIYVSTSNIVNEISTISMYSKNGNDILFQGLKIGILKK